MKSRIFLCCIILFILSCSLVKTDEFKSWGQASDYYLYKNSHVLYVKYYKRYYTEGDNLYDELLGYVLYDFNYKTSVLKYKIFESPNEMTSKLNIYSQNDTIYITGAIKAKYHIDNFAPEEFNYNDSILDNGFYVMPTESLNVYLIYQYNMLKLYNSSTKQFRDYFRPTEFPLMIYSTLSSNYIVSVGGNSCEICDIVSNNTHIIEFTDYEFDKRSFNSVKWDSTGGTFMILREILGINQLITEYNPVFYSDTTYEYNKRYYRNSDGNYLDFDYEEMSIYDSNGNLLQVINYEEDL